MIENVDDKAAALRIIDIIHAEGSPNPREEFIRQVRLLDCVREVIERTLGREYWTMIYQAADRLRREKAERLAATGESWES